MKDLYERVLEEAENQEVTRHKAISTWYKGWKKIIDKHGSLAEYAGRAFHTPQLKDYLFNQMNARDELLFRYVRRYMKSEK